MNAQAERPAADDELLIRREFAAPVALVYRIWQQREHMVRWLGPTDFTCTSLDWELKPGRPWRACITSEAYGDSWMAGVIREVEPERRIVYSFAWEDGRDQPGVETLVTVTFEERGGRTIQCFHQAPFIDVGARDSHVGGWNQCFDRERAYVEALAGGGNP